MRLTSTLRGGSGIARRPGTGGIAGTFAGETTRRILSTLSTLFLVASVVYVYNTLASGGAYNNDARNLGDLAALGVLLSDLQLPIEPFGLFSPVLG